MKKWALHPFQFLHDGEFKLDKIEQTNFDDDGDRFSLFGGCVFTVRQVGIVIG